MYEAGTFLRAAYIRTDNTSRRYYAPLFAEPSERRYGQLVSMKAWPEDIADEDILKNLLALNLERSERGAPLIHPTS